MLGESPFAHGPGTAGAGVLGVLEKLEVVEQREEEGNMKEETFDKTWLVGLEKGAPKPVVTRFDKLDVVFCFLHSVCTRL